MRPFTSSTALATLFAVIVAAPAAQALVIGVGDSLDVRFHFSAPPVAPAGPVDLLQFFENDTHIAGTHTVVGLYDGTTLLGQMNFDPGIFAEMVFIAPGAPWTFPTFTTAADFSSIVNGTIDGHLLITVTSGSTDIVVGPMRAGHDFDSNSFNPASPAPIIDSQTVIAAAAAPEPAAGLIFGLSLAALARLRRRKA